MRYVCVSLLVLCSAALQHPVHISRAHESVLSMHGNLLPLGIFYTNVSIGSPPVDFAVTIDTGSTDLLVPVNSCIGCKPGAPAYSPTASSTSAIEACNKTVCSVCVGPQQQQCAFSDSYLTCDLSNLTATCTVAGGIFRDSVNIGGMRASGVRFGGITTQTKNFDQFQQIDGILGLAFPALGFDVSPFERVVQQNPGVRNVVQTCLTPSGGLLVLGVSEDDRKYYEGELLWTPITLASWYTVHAEALDVDGKDTGVKGEALNGPFPDDPCIVDSGTNFLSLTAAAYNATVERFQALCHTRNLTGVCNVDPSSPEALFGGAAVQILDESVRMFPNVTITLTGDRGGAVVPLTVTPAEYLVAVGERKYRMGITRGDCIIGNTHMLRYYTVYDREMNRVGFAPAKQEQCMAARETML